MYFYNDVMMAVLGVSLAVVAGICWYIYENKGD